MKSPTLLRLSELKDKKKNVLIPARENEVNIAASSEKSQQGENTDIQ